MKDRLYFQKYKLGITIPMLLIFAVALVFPQRGSANVGGYKEYLPMVRLCLPPANPIINGDFELGNTGWIFSPNVNANVVTSGANGITPHGGNMMVSINSAHYYGDTSGFIEQSFTVPECSPYLSFWWAAVVGCGPISGGRCEADLSISIDDTPITSFTLYGGGTRTWQRIVLDTYLYRGSTLSFRFTANASTRDGIINYIDDFSFTEPPVPSSFSKTSPANAHTNQPTNPILSWEASSYSTHYEYCIDSTDDNACTTPWISTDLDTSITLGDLTSGIYFWQVRAINGTGTTDANGESAWWSFTVPPETGTFKKLDPSDGATNQPPYGLFLFWGESSNAVSYEYCFDTTNDNTCTTTWNSVMAPYTSVPLNFLAAATYYWQVRAVNAASTTYADGESTWWSFTVPPVPGAFNKITPPDSANNQSPNLTLSWEASSGALSYGYCIGYSPDNPCGTGWSGSGTSTSVDLCNLEPGTYYWQVRAENGTGKTFANGGAHEYDQTAWWSFTVP